MIPKTLIPFDYVWNMAVQEVSGTVKDAIDPEFETACGLKIKDYPEWRKEVYDQYQHLREQLKCICYGPSDARNPEDLLDGRKIAAVLCASLISKKGFLFNVEAARDFTSAKRAELADDPVRFNKWAVSNVYVNYKMAYFASLQMVYLTLMRDLLVEAGLNESNESVHFENPRTQKQEDARQLAIALNNQRQLCPYPQPPKGDGFDVNIIIGLARTDMSVKDLDMFLFAMQLYQIEEHTKDQLKQELLKADALKRNA